MVQAGSHKVSVVYHETDDAIKACFTHGARRAAGELTVEVLPVRAAAARLDVGQGDNQLDNESKRSMKAYLSAVDEHGNKLSPARHKHMQVRGDANTMVHPARAASHSPAAQCHQGSQVTRKATCVMHRRFVAHSLYTSHQRCRARPICAHHCL